MNGGAAALAEVLRRRAGLEKALLPEHALERHLRGGVGSAGAPGGSNAAERLWDDGAARDRLLDAVLVPETWFFRDWEPFEHLKRHVAARPGRWRVLSLGCSTGEEAYSVAMALLSVPGVEPEVDGVDLGAASLARAATACYGRAAFREPRWTAYRDFFTETDRGRTVREEVRRVVRLRRGNALDLDRAEGVPPWDVVLCRNLLIYLCDEARARVLGNLDRSLAPGGLLVLGHAEAPSVLAPGYAAVPEPRTFAAIKPGADVGAPGASAETRTPAAAAPGEQGFPTFPRPAGTPAPPPRTSPEGDACAVAAALAAQGHTAAAAASCRALLAREPLHVGAHLLLAALAMSSGRLGEAEEWLRRTLYLAPRNLDALARMAELLEATDRRQQALLLRARAQRAAGGADG